MHFFDCVRMLDVLPVRTSPFSTHRSDCIRIGLNMRFFRNRCACLFVSNKQREYSVCTRYKSYYFVPFATFRNAYDADILCIPGLRCKYVCALFISNKQRVHSTCTRYMSFYFARFATFRPACDVDILCIPGWRSKQASMSITR